MEIDQENLHLKFSALNVDFSSPSPNLLRLRRPTHVACRYLLKSGYFTTVGSSSMKTVSDRLRHFLITTSTGDVLYSGINIDDFKGP